MSRNHWACGPELDMDVRAFAPDAAGKLRLYKGGGGGSGYYKQLNSLYKEQADSARLLREQAEANLPGAVNNYIGKVNEITGEGYAQRQADMASADMASANAMERTATERELTSMGVNPNDPRFAGSMRSTEMNNAARMAAGKNLARNDAQKFQLAVAQDAVGTFTGQSNSAATQMGNASSGLASMAQNQAANKQAAAAQRSDNVSNIVGGSMAAWNMAGGWKDGGEIPRFSAGGIARAMPVGHLVDPEGDGRNLMENTIAGALAERFFKDGGEVKHAGALRERWAAASGVSPRAPSGKPAHAPGYGTGGASLETVVGTVLRSGADAFQALENFAPRAARPAGAARTQSAGLAPVRPHGTLSALKEGGEVRPLERHMAGGQTGNAQRNAGFFQMQAIAPPPAMPAPQKPSGAQQAVQALKMARTGKQMYDAGKNIATKVEAMKTGANLTPEQAKAAKDAYSSAADAVRDTNPQLAAKYDNLGGKLETGQKWFGESAAAETSGKVAESATQEVAKEAAKEGAEQALQQGGAEAAKQVGTETATNVAGSAATSAAGGAANAIPVAGAVLNAADRIANGQDAGQAVAGAAGGLAGAKAGAALGSFAGPVGTAVGGVAGGILGSLGVDLAFADGGEIPSSAGIETANQVNALLARLKDGGAVSPREEFSRAWNDDIEQFNGGGEAQGIEWSSMHRYGNKGPGGFTNWVFHEETPQGGAETVLSAVGDVVGQKILDGSIKFADGGEPTVPTIDGRNGGPVHGPGSHTDDVVPALLSAGEGVLNGEAMALGGKEVMEELNKQGLEMRRMGISPDQIRGLRAARMKKEGV